MEQKREAIMKKKKNFLNSPQCKIGFLCNLEPSWNKIEISNSLRWKTKRGCERRLRRMRLNSCRPRD